MGKGGLWMWEGPPMAGTRPLWGLLRGLGRVRVRVRSGSRVNEDLLVLGGYTCFSEIVLEVLDTAEGHHRLALRGAAAEWPAKQGSDR